MAVVKNLMVRCGADFSALFGASKKAQSSMSAMQRSVQGASRTVTRSVSTMNKSANKLGSVFKSLGLVIGAAAIIKFGKDALEAASNLQEVQNVVDTAFGNMAYKIEEFAKNSIENFGMSALAAKRTAGTYMAMAKSMGLSKEAASDMAVNLTGLTGDVASFYNVSQGVADTALKSVFTGETESLKKFGVVMTEVNLQEFAYRQGLKKKISAMTQAEKTQLRYLYVTQQLSLASGDFAKTSNSWANQTRILSERFNQLKVAVGQGLIQALTPALQMLNRVMEKLVELGNKFAQVTAFLFGKQKALAATSQEAADAESDLGDSVSDASKKTKKALASFDELNILQDKIAESAEDAAGGDSGVGVDPGAVDEAEESVSALEKTLKKIKDAAQPVIDAFNRLKDALAPVRDFVAKGIESFYQNFLVPVGKWVLGEALPRLLDILTGLAKSINWDELNTALEKLWTILAEFTIGIGNGLIRFFELVADTIKKIDWKKIWDGLKNIWEAVKPFAQTIGKGLEWFYINVIEPLVVWAANDLIPAALDLVAAALEFLDEIIKAAAPAFEWIWNDFLKPVGEWTGKQIISAITDMKNAFKSLSDWARNNQAVIRNMATALLGFFGGIWVYNTTKKLVDFVMYLASAFATMAGKISIAGMAATMANVGIGLLGAAVLLIAANWDKMNGIEKTIAILGAIAIAAAAAAAAIGALQSAWSLGIAAAAIVAGIVAIGVAIKSANSDASKSLSNIQPPTIPAPKYQVPALASGAVIEPNKEFLAILGDQKQGTNIEAPLSTIEDAMRNVMNERKGNGDIVLQLDGVTFARLTNPYNVAENNRRGVRLVEGLG
jgi:hypothetical protein